VRGLQAAGGAPLSGLADRSGRDGDGVGGAADGVREAADAAARAPAGPGRARRRVGVLAAIAVSVYVLDLISKIVVVEHLEGRPPVQLIGELLQLRVIRNSGAAFSIGTGMTIVFTVIATVVVIAILRTARDLRSLPWASTLGLLLGGALGNLTDRIFRSPAPFQGHVVDFIAVPDFPVFNVADSAIVCGGVLAVFLAWRGYQLDGTRQTGDDRADDPADGGKDVEGAKSSDPAGPASGDTGRPTEDATAGSARDSTAGSAGEATGGAAGDTKPAAGERADG
jgi:signal peptidase II